MAFLTHSGSITFHSDGGTPLIGYLSSPALSFLLYSSCPKGSFWRAIEFAGRSERSGTGSSALSSFCGFDPCGTCCVPPSAAVPSISRLSHLLLLRPRLSLNLDILEFGDLNEQPELQDPYRSPEGSRFGWRVATLTCPQAPKCDSRRALWCRGKGGLCAWGSP